MDDFDRDRPNRSGEPYGRRRERRPETDDRDAIRRRPDFGDEPESAPRRRQSRDRRPVDGEEPEYRPRRTSQTRDEERVPRERYSDRFRRQRPYREEEVDDRSYRAARDPYDRLRRVGNRPARRVETDVEADFDYEQYDDEFELEPASGRTRRRTTRQQPPRIDQQRLREMGSVLTHPAPELRPLVLGGALAVASLLLLAILVLVRSGSLDAYIPLYLDAEGTPTTYGEKSAIWRLPFFALVATLMMFGLGWWLRVREAYAVQYLVVGALLVHLLIWVGIINLLW